MNLESWENLKGKNFRASLAYHGGITGHVEKVCILLAQEGLGMETAGREGIVPKKCLWEEGLNKER